MTQPTSHPFDQASVGGGGFTWAGELTQMSVSALYAACHSLRFTGFLELSDDHHQAKVTFLGGDPVEIDGGDTQMISLWQNGTFRALQSIPNLAGELTGQTEQTGSLAITKGPRLLAWVSEYRLSCDLSIERPGEKASLVFRNGQLESAEVNGQPELGALARVQGWSDGFYRVALRPLFTGGHLGATNLKPPPVVDAPLSAREFDLSRSIPLDLKQKAKLGTPSFGNATFGPPHPEPVPVEPPRRAMPRLSSGTDPVVSASERAPAPVASGARTAMWLGIGLVIIGGAVGSLYAMKLPPFSLPPRPVEIVAPTPVEPKVEAPKPAEPKPSELKPIAKRPEPERPTEPEKPVDPAALEPHPVEKKGVETPATAPLDQRLIEKGRLLLIDGHPHSALQLFHKAEQSNSKNLLAKTLEQQALGKLGKAELFIDGHGSVAIDGKRFDAPKKLKTFAGPHAVDTGAGPEELVLKKGDKHHLRAHP